MEKNQMTEAFREALKDASTIAYIAEAVSKKIIEKKSNPKTLEDKLVKNHVIFAEADNTKAAFMTAREIADKIESFSTDQKIAIRRFGKSLTLLTKHMKNSNAGKVYFVVDVVEDLSSYVDSLEVDAEEVDDSESEMTLIDELENLNKKELKAYIKENELDIDTANMDELNLRIAILNLHHPEEEEAEEAASVEPPKKEKKPKKSNKDEAEFPSEKEVFGDVKLTGAKLGGMNREELEEVIRENDLAIKLKKKYTDLDIAKKIIIAMDLDGADIHEANDLKKEKAGGKKDKAGKKNKKPVDLSAEDLTDLEPKKKKKKKKNK